MEIAFPTLDALPKAAADFAAAMGSHRVFAFEGEMGAGKTTFIKALCQRLGVAEVVTSPTFAIVNEYTSSVLPCPIFHFDCYRLRSLAEAYDIGCEDYFYTGLCLIEWPEVVASILPEDTVYVRLCVDERGCRTLSFNV